MLTDETIISIILSGLTAFTLYLLISLIKLIGKNFSTDERQVEAMVGKDQRVLLCFTGFSWVKATRPL